MKRELIFQHPRETDPRWRGNQPGVAGTGEAGLQAPPPD